MLCKTIRFWGHNRHKTVQSTSNTLNLFPVNKSWLKRRWESILSPRSGIKSRLRLKPIYLLSTGRLTMTAEETPLVGDDLCFQPSRRGEKRSPVSRPELMGAGDDAVNSQHSRQWISDIIRTAKCCSMWALLCAIAWVCARISVSACIFNWAGFSQCV